MSIPLSPVVPTALCLCLCLSAAAQGPDEPTVAELSYQAVKKWSIELPRETWSSAQPGIGVAHRGGDRFATRKEGLGLSLAIDTDGDGQTDAEVKGRRGFVVLRGEDRDGAKLTYAVRLEASGKTYRYAASGWMRGKVAGETVRLIDQNNNGRYDEVGVDAMVTGKSRAASFLSRVVNLKGDLYEMTVQSDGRRVTLRPFRGEAGTLDLHSGFRSRGKLKATVVEDGRGRSFELASARQGLLVPAGEYQLASGVVAKGNERVRLDRGRMPDFVVHGGRTTEVEWGGEVVAVFDHLQIGGRVEIHPDTLRFYGRAGEEYRDFAPRGASPKFLVYDERTRKLIKTGRFGT